MNKLKIKSLFIIFSLVLSSIATYVVVHSEMEKKAAKLASLKSSYKNQFDQLESFRKEYEKQIGQLKNENLTKMEESKNKYNILLSQQPAIVKQHTATVVDGSTQNNSDNRNIAAVTQSSSATTKTVKVSKPRSAPVTSAS